jgi:hypothetical protein
MRLPMFKAGDEVVVMHNGVIGRVIFVDKIDNDEYVYVVDVFDSGQYSRFNECLLDFTLNKHRYPNDAKSNTESAKKMDSGKPRVELVSATAMIEIAKVLEFGARKYGDHNWRKGMPWSKVLGSTLRHIFAFMSGEDIDSDSGCSHLSCAMCEIMFLVEYQKLNVGVDDRFKLESKESK